MICCSICFNEMQSAFFQCRCEKAMMCEDCFGSYTEMEIENNNSELSCMRFFNKTNENKDCCTQEWDVFFLFQKLEKPEQVFKYIQPLFYQQCKQKIISFERDPSSNEWFEILMKGLKKFENFIYQYAYFEKRSKDIVCDTCKTEKKMCEFCNYKSYFSFCASEGKYFSYYLDENGYPKHTVEEAQKITDMFKKYADEVKTFIQSVWENYTGEIATQNSASNGRKTFVARCPKNFIQNITSEQDRCFGFVLKDTGRCTQQPMCTQVLCISCLTPKTEDHKCDPEAKQTTTYNFANLKQCPTCFAFCSKVDGCDVMWCVLCKNGFDWVTGKYIDLVKERRHNPDFSRYLQERKTTVREARDFHCGGLPPFLAQNLVSQLDLDIRKTLTDVYFRNISDFVMERLPTIRDATRGFITTPKIEEHLLRLFFAKKITEKQLFNRLWEFEVYKCKIQELLHVYEDFSRTATEFFVSFDNEFLLTNMNDYLKDAKITTFKKKFEFFFNSFNEEVSQINRNLTAIYEKYGENELRIDYSKSIESEFIFVTIPDCQYSQFDDNYQLSHQWFDNGNGENPLTIRRTGISELFNYGKFFSCLQNSNFIDIETVDNEFYWEIPEIKFHLENDRTPIQAVEDYFNAERKRTGLENFRNINVCREIVTDEILKSHIKRK